MVYGDPDATRSDPYIPEPDDSGGEGGSDDDSGGDSDLSRDERLGRQEDYAAATGQLDELAKERAGQGGPDTDLSEIDEQDREQAQENAEQREIADDVQSDDGPSVGDVAEDVQQAAEDVGGAAKEAGELATSGPLDTGSTTQQDTPEPTQDTSPLTGPFQGENLSPPEQAANRITRTAKRAARNPQATATAARAATASPLAYESDAAQTAQDAARAEQRAREQLGLPDPTRQTQATLSGDGLSAQEAGLTLEQARSLNPVGRANAQPTNQPTQRTQASGSLQAPELEREQLGNQQFIVPDRVGPVGVPGEVANIPVAGNTITNIGQRQARGARQFTGLGADLLVPDQAPASETVETYLGGGVGAVLGAPGEATALAGEGGDVAQFATDPTEGSATDRAAEIGEQATLIPVSIAQGAARNPAEFAGEATFSLGTSAVAGKALEAGVGRTRTAIANRRSDVGEVPPEAVFQEDVAQALREGEFDRGNIPPGERPEPGDAGPVDTFERTQRQEIDDDIRQAIPGDEPLGINISPADSAPPQQGFQIFERGKQRPDDPQGGFFLAPAGNPVVAIDEADVGGPGSSSVLTADPRRFRLPSLRRSDDAVLTATRGEVRKEPESVGNEAATQDAPEQTLEELAQENPDASVEELAEQSDDFTVNEQGRIVQTTPGDESRFLQSQRGEPVQFVRSEANRSPAEAESIAPGGTIVETTNPNLGFVRIGDDTIRLRGGRLRDPENPDVDITVGSERTSARLGNPFGRSTSRRRGSDSDADGTPRDQPAVPIVPGTPSDDTQSPVSDTSPTSGSGGSETTDATSGAGGGSDGGFSPTGFGISGGGPGGSDGGPGSGSGPGGGPSFVGFGGGSGGGGSGGGGGGSGGSAGGGGGGTATGTDTPFTPTPNRRTPLPDFELDEDEDVRTRAVIGDKSPTLVDFLNPITGERLETDPGVADEN